MTNAILQKIQLTDDTLIVLMGSGNIIVEQVNTITGDKESVILDPVVIKAIAKASRLTKE